MVDTNRRQVTRAGERIGLTYTEFSLLEMLFREPAVWCPRAEILEQLWATHHVAPPTCALLMSMWPACAASSNRIPATPS